MTLEGYLLVAGAVMTLIVTSRPAMRALRDYGTDAIKIWRALRAWGRRFDLAALGERLHSLTQDFEEHATDAELHGPAVRRRVWEDPDA